MADFAALLPAGIRCGDVAADTWTADEVFLASVCPALEVFFMTPSDQQVLILHLYEVKKMRVLQIAHLLCFSHRAVRRVITQAYAHRTTTCSPPPRRSLGLRVRAPR